MTLEARLLGVDLHFVCPQCHQDISRSGSYFKTVRWITCPHCGARTELGYEQKLALFRRHEKTPQDQAALYVPSATPRS